MGRAVIVATDQVTSLSLGSRSDHPRLASRLAHPIAATAALGIGLAAGAAALDAAPIGRLTHHMSFHILLMNVLAPLIALALARHRPIRVPGVTTACGLALATVAQLAALWIAHAPPVMAAAFRSPVTELAVQGMLLGAALWFWLSVYGQRGTARWRALLALLLTGKLFCLLAVLLVFSPRQLYPAMAWEQGVAAVPVLADQQLAGLLMIVACPLTYVLVAVIITARWLKEIGQDAGPPVPAERCR